MCAALEYQIISKVEEELIMITENVPQNEKLTLCLDNYFQQLQNQNVPTEMWNVNIGEGPAKQARVGTSTHYWKTTA
jgi:hypothetical protein